MPGWRRWIAGPVMAASAMWSTPLAAQKACALATAEEFQQAYGVDPRIGLLPDSLVETEMVWGPHCDYADGSIDLFTRKSPKAELDRVLALTKADKRRDPVPGLGQRAFFTLIYPDDKYRRRGLLAIFDGPRLLTISMDLRDDEAPEATRPRLEGLAKKVLPRLE